MLATYETPFKLRVLWQENAGQPEGLNRAVSGGSGTFCLLLDDDVIAGRDSWRNTSRPSASKVMRWRSDGSNLRRPLIQTGLYRILRSWERQYRRLGSAGASSPAPIATRQSVVPRAAFLAGERLLHRHWAGATMSSSRSG
jgi:hypothetical protein